jgi:hypothetical protein
MAMTPDAPTAATDDDVRWLSYAELAQAFGLKRDSAVRLSFRRKWRRQEGNDGTARVAVPLTVIADAERRRTTGNRDARQDGRPSHVGRGDNLRDAAAYAAAFETALKGIEAEHARHLDDLREAHAREVEAIRAQVESAKDMAGRFATSLRDQSDTMRLELARHSDEVAYLRGRIEALERERQEAARDPPGAVGAGGDDAPQSPEPPSTAPQRGGKGWFGRWFRWQ